jgi:hypothetical protein
MSQHQTWRGAVAICVVGGRAVAGRLGASPVGVLPMLAQHAGKVDSLAR